MPPEQTYLLSTTLKWLLMAAMSTQPSDQETQQLLARMLFMSDAVFAIVMTLLVLDLRIPSGFSDATLFRDLLILIPKFVAFTTSFALVSVCWIAHAAMTRNLLKFDWLVAWANLILLFTLAWTPFAASLLGEFRASRNSWQFYCLILIAIGAAEAFLFLVIARDGGRLIGGIARREFWYRLIRAFSPSIGFAIALIFSLMGLSLISYMSWVVIPAILVGSQLALKPKRPPAPTATAV
jgi:uncharacterized membrane protein